MEPVGPDPAVGRAGLVALAQPMLVKTLESKMHIVTIKDRRADLGDGARRRCFYQIEHASGNTMPTKIDGGVIFI